MFEKIEDFGENCVSSAPDILTGTAAENKAWFDKAVKNVVAAAFNKLVEELAGESAVEHIGAEGGTLKEKLDALTEETAKKVDKVEGKGLSDNNFSDADKEKLDTVGEGAQVNKIESITYNGTLLDVTDKTVSIDTYKGMKKIGETELQTENTSITLNSPVTRGCALLTWPEEEREVTGKPIGYVIDANGNSKPVTSYQNGIGKYVTGYYLVEFEIFSKVAKVSSYAVFSADGAESEIIVSDSTVNTDGKAQGVKFYYREKFPVGTKLELWGE